MEFGPTYDTVIRLRTVRKELGLSIKEIYTMLCDTPGLKSPPSESSLNRVFNGDLNAISGFSYDNTLRPLCELLFPKMDPQDSELTKARIGGLMAEIEVQKQTIRDLSAQLKETRERYERERRESEEKQGKRCSKCEKDMEYLKKQIDLKDARMDKKDEWIDRLLGHIEEMLHDTEKKKRDLGEIHAAAD